MAWVAFSAAGSAERWRITRRQTLFLLAVLHDVAAEVVAQAWEPDWERMVLIHVEEVLPKVLEKATILKTMKTMYPACLHACMQG